jgi:predicted ATPase
MNCPQCRTENPDGAHFCHQCGTGLFQRGWIAAAAIATIEILDNLQSLLMARIDRLPDEARQMVRVASAIGRQFPVRVLEYILGKGQTR